MTNHILLTQDASPTLYSDTYKQTYHSAFGAEQESLLVFIQNGFLAFRENLHTHSQPIPNTPINPIRILECGMGTGLNIALTWEKADQLKQACVYVSCEKYPPEAPLLEAYSEQSRLKALLISVTSAPWNTPVRLSPYFTLLKLEHDFTLPLPPHGQEAYRTESSHQKAIFDVIYYDAFSPDAQPELWNPQQLAYICSLLQSGGIFCTYCAKGIVKTALREARMLVKRRPGPPGKKHILQAFAPETEFD